LDRSTGAREERLIRGHGHNLEQLTAYVDPVRIQPRVLGVKGLGRTTTSHVILSIQ